MPDHQPLGHVRGPGVGERRRGRPGPRRHQPRRPGAGQHEHGQQQPLLHHGHRQHPGQQVGQQLGRHRPRHRPVRAEHRPGERRVRHEHHVVGEDDPRPSTGRQHEQAGDQPDRRAPAGRASPRARPRSARRPSGRTARPARGARSTYRRLCAPTAARRAGSASSPSSASASAPASSTTRSFGGTTISWFVPQAVVTTGSPLAIASRYASPNCSYHFQVDRGAVTNTAADRSTRRPGRRPRGRGSSTPGPRTRTDDQRAVAEHQQPSLRHPGPHQRERRQHPVDPLVRRHRRDERQHGSATGPGAGWNRSVSTPGLHDPDPVLVARRAPAGGRAAASTRQRNRSAPSARVASPRGKGEPRTAAGAGRSPR